MENKILIMCHVFKRALSPFCSYFEKNDEKYICILRHSDCNFINFIEYNRRQAFKDGKHINIYNFLTYHLLIIIFGIWIVNLLVKTGLCYILSRRFGGAP